MSGGALFGSERERRLAAMLSVCLDWISNLEIVAGSEIVGATMPNNVPGRLSMREEIGHQRLRPGVRCGYCGQEWRDPEDTSGGTATPPHPCRAHVRQLRKSLRLDLSEPYDDPLRGERTEGIPS